ncbi:Com family DNA-binding transcriptional regulator, partial [Desulfovibrio sp. UIB00]|uniref:Mom family adenine methylcarbamoylation protein n=1 Tax=Desulfovibrio sp. UIB00 TaxID=2804314 RepID=UPI001F10C1D9
MGKEIRCGNCNRLLARGEALALTIKCPRCGCMNHVRATSPDIAGLRAPWSVRVGTSPRPYHPPKISEYQAPQSEHAGYIEGPTGCQGFGSRDAFVALIPCRLARETIIKHHYSHRVVNNSYLHLGVYLEGHTLGVLQFGYALCPARAGKVVEGTVQGQYLELNRMWLDDAAPRNSESRAISQATKYIKRAMPSGAWVQSYADERC